MASRSSRSAPRIVHVCNLWSMVGQQTAGQEWTLERKMKSARDAGFDAVSTIPGPEHAELAEKLGLRLLGSFAGADPAHFPEILGRMREAGVHHVNVQLGRHDTPTRAAVSMTRKLMEAGRRAGVEPSVEVHRNTCTETPEKTEALANGYQKATGELLPLTWDFSHPAVVKHLAPPYGERLLTRPDLVRRARQFHLRPFNGHHCQVPVTNGRGVLTPEFEQWLPFAEQIMETWLGAPANREAEFFAMPEMGPVSGGYNLSILPDSWKEAVCLREILDRSWRKVARRVARAKRKK